MKKKTLRCKWFGCKISGSMYAHPPYYTRYLKANAGPVDNIGRHHIELVAKCDRCEQEFNIGYIHGTVEGNILK